MRAAGYWGITALDTLVDNRLSPVTAARSHVLQRLGTASTFAADHLAVAARVTFSGSHFELSDEGTQALIVAAFDELGDIADMAAMSIADERVTALHGGATWALGLQTIYPTVGEPVQVHRTPWQYLAAGHGLYVFDWKVARRWRVETDAQFMATDEDNARELHALLEVPAPEIFFPDFAQKVAA